MTSQVVSRRFRGLLDRSRLLSATVFAVLATVVCGLWWRIEQGGQLSLRLETEVIADQVKLRLEAWVDTRMAVVEHVAQEWLSEYASDTLEFEQDAQALIDRFPGFTAFNWIDSQGVIRIVVPKRGNQAALNRSLWEHSEPSVSKALERAISSGKVSRTRASIRFFQGGRGFAAYWPVRTAGGDLVGLLNGVFQVQQSVDMCLAEERLHRRFRFEFREAGERVASSRGLASDSTEWPYRIDQAVRIVDAPWQLSIAPSESRLAQEVSWYRWIILAASLAFALAIALLLGVLMRRQKALKASEERVRLLLDSTFESIYGLDLEGNCTFCNSALLSLLGYDEPDQLLGRNMHELVHHSHAAGAVYPEEDCGVHQAFLRGEAAHFCDEVVWRRNGTSFPAECRSHPVRKNGEITGAVVTLVDITEQKQQEERRRDLERQMQDSQRLESLGVLAGGIAHDFNNMLVGILGNASLALDRTDEQSALHLCVRDIETAARRASELINQLLAYSGKGQFSKQVIDLNELVGEMLQLLKLSISKQAELTCDFGEHPCPVNGDPTQIRQVVMNLITNASDAVGKLGGRIIIRTGVSEVGAEELRQTLAGSDLEPGRFSFVEVADTGPGIDQQVRARIFDPFFSTKGTGRGLGLASSLGIVRSHGGAVRLTSSKGAGTVMRILFPWQETVAAGAPAQAEPATSGSRSGTVLVIDDEELVRTVAGRILRRAGLTVLMASDGQQGLDLQRQHADEIDLVILDKEMPGKSGLETLKALKQQQSTVRVVLSTGYTESEALQEFQRSGLDGFIQ